MTDWADEFGEGEVELDDPTHSAIDIHSDKMVRTDDTDDEPEDDDTDDAPLLAELDEERKTQVQIEKIQTYTVEPGLMKLPVIAVSAVEDNPNVSIVVDHPFEGEVQFHLSKPRTWDPENELVQFLDWYGLHISDLYHLQTRSVYIDVTPEKPRDWELVPPPNKLPSRTQRAGQAVTSAVQDATLGVFGGVLTIVSAIALSHALAFQLSPWAGTIGWGFSTFAVSVIGVVVAFAAFCIATFLAPPDN